jgi:hypothetical protein
MPRSLLAIRGAKLYDGSFEQWSRPPGLPSREGRSPRPPRASRAVPQEKAAPPDRRWRRATLRRHAQRKTAPPGIGPRPPCGRSPHGHRRSAAQLTSVFADGFESGNTFAWSASARGAGASPGRGLPPERPRPARAAPLRDRPDRRVLRLHRPGLSVRAGTVVQRPAPGGDHRRQRTGRLLDSSFLLEFRPFDEAAATT